VVFLESERFRAEERERIRQEKRADERRREENRSMMMMMMMVMMNPIRHHDFSSTFPPPSPQDSTTSSSAASVRWSGFFECGVNEKKFRCLKSLLNFLERLWTLLSSELFKKLFKK